MKKFLIASLGIFVLGTVAYATDLSNILPVAFVNNVDVGTEGGHHIPFWTIIPFVTLLLMIATGPLFYEHFWHSNYPRIAFFLAAIVESYYIFGLNDIHAPIHSLAEYVQFISLLAALYIASGGIIINIDKKASPMVNVLLLLVGGVLANLIGTTGASMLLIRPFIRLNKARLSAYHVIFFIFIVSNIGGSLTPIGDPPLFLGFLKGVPFFWTLTHNFLPWITALLLLCGAFYFFDIKNKKVRDIPGNDRIPTGKVSLTGFRNFGWLGIIIGSVFLDPNVITWLPAIHFDGQKFSFIREIIMLTTAYLAYTTTSKKVHEDNHFSLEPIREVAFLFVGIFGTMMPALEMIGSYAASPSGAALVSGNTLYWFTGFLSGFLDNAPTYVNFLTAAMASEQLNINILTDVTSFAISNGLYLKAISIGSVFFGAFTYIGNGPNFMVKSIAEEIGLRMPSFFGYIIRFSIPVLLPLFVIIWWLFFW